MGSRGKALPKGASTCMKTCLRNQNSHAKSAPKRNSYSLAVVIYLPEETGMCKAVHGDGMVGEAFEADLVAEALRVRHPMSHLTSRPRMRPHYLWTEASFAQALDKHINRRMRNRNGHEIGSMLFLENPCPRKTNHRTLVFCD